ncbi:hypothetical protein [Dactylosporangium sp. CA-233914]|uniref:hypothetical protein n=1 Tax=Dactylosporangium sp. CA-233914 TaxID=3239934 RepID=UPI003D946CCE
MGAGTIAVNPWWPGPATQARMHLKLSDQSSAARLSALVGGDAWEVLDAGIGRSRITA